MTYLRSRGLEPEAVPEQTQCHVSTLDLDLDLDLCVPASDDHGHSTSQHRQPVSFLERYCANFVR